MNHQKDWFNSQDYKWSDVKKARNPEYHKAKRVGRKWQPCSAFRAILGNSLNHDVLEDGAGTIHRVRGETDFGSLQEDVRFKWHLLCANHFCGSFTLGDSLSYLSYLKDPSST